MIPANIIEEIRKQADIVNVISSYINVIKKGNSYTAICPFHADKHPSMMISKTKQIYKCFACGAGGNVFNFVAEYEKISFIEAVKKVASMIGFHDKSLEEPERQVSDAYKEVIDALKDAQELYHYALNTEEGKAANEYLQKRAIDEEMQQFFKLGYCSDSKGLTIKLLRAKNHSVDTLDKAGILVRDNDATFIDRFHGRLMFPIFNEYQEVVGFSGRIITSNGEAKYVNSPSTSVFNKSNVLYNYQNAKANAKREGAVYVVEGFMDVFALYKAGIKSSVALMGTAFTAMHARLLKLLGVEVRILLDGDDAGRKGALNMCLGLDKVQVPYRVVDYKECVLDPDEILQQYGVDTLKKFTTRLISKRDFIISYYQKHFNLQNDDGRLKFIEALIPYAHEIDDDVEFEIFVNRIAKLVDINYQTLSQRIKNHSINKENTSNANAEMFIKPRSKKLTRLERIEKLLLLNIINNPSALVDFQECEGYFIDHLYEVILSYIREVYSTNHEYTSNQILDLINLIDEKDKKQYIDEVSTLFLEEVNSYDPEEFMELINNHKEEIKNKAAKDRVSNIVTKNDPIEAARNLDALNKQKKGGN